MRIASKLAITGHTVDGTNKIKVETYGKMKVDDTIEICMNCPYPTCKTGECRLIRDAKRRKRDEHSADKSN